MSGPGPRFDLILVDGYDAKGRVGALDTPSFYRNCRGRLSDDGLLATNLLSRHRGIDASLARLAETFERRAMSLAPCASGNIIALAARGDAVDLDARELAARATAFRAETELNLTPTVERLARRQKAYAAPAVL